MSKSKVLQQEKKSFIEVLEECAMDLATVVDEYLIEDNEKFVELKLVKIKLKKLVTKLQKLRDTPEISVFHAGEIMAYNRVLGLLGTKETQKE